MRTAVPALRGISIHALVKRATEALSLSALSQPISIHALVKRATKENFNNMLVSGISIHALVKRATRAAQKNFHGACISIHALVKRATTQIGRPSKLFVYFNPRPRKEGDGFNIFIG